MSESHQKKNGGKFRSRIVIAQSQICCYINKTANALGHRIFLDLSREFNLEHVANVDHESPHFGRKMRGLDSNMASCPESSGIQLKENNLTDRQEVRGRLSILVVKSESSNR
jgi:hypothetical protein